jgi:hypothetical protein
VRQIRNFVLLGLLLGIFAVNSAPVFAEMSDTYITTIFVERVYNHRLGYKVDYNISNFRIGEVYIPHTWFTPAGQAEIVFVNSQSAPYMQVVYRNGEFSHVRLFVHRSPGHPSWRSLQDSEEVAQRFQATTFNVRY